MPEEAPPVTALEILALGLISAATILLYYAGIFNYLLFHSSVEIISAVIAFTVTVITLISRKRISGSYLLFIGVSFLFTALIDLVHTLAYKGMGIFASTANIPTSLWILARYLQAGSFLAAPLLHRRSLNIRNTLVGFSMVTALGMASIIAWDVFPTTYVEGAGLTTFKVVSEYLISLMLLASLILLRRIRGEFKPKIYSLLSYSIILSILSEIAFTDYVGVYDFANLIGHILKLGVAYLLFKALVKEGIEDPFGVLFRDYQIAQNRLVGQTEELREKTERLDAMNSELSARNEELRASEEELKKNSDQLTVYTSRLEEMVDEKTKEVRAGEEKLRQSYAVAAVGRMGATIAHDLKTPLNIISQAAEGIDKFPESRERLIEMIRGNAGRALDMIEDIRNATRDIEVRAITTNLASMMRSAVDESSLPESVEARIDVGEGLDAVMIDPNLVRRVLDNLIRNSVEAMPDGGILTVNAHKKGDTITISIGDTGIGIGEEAARRIFEPFYTTKSNGTGLGLPFCRRAVEAHDGELTFMSKKGSGTVFTAVLREKANQ